MTGARLTIILSFVASLICGQGWAAVPAGSQQYIVRVKHLFVQPNASAPAPIKSVVGQLGGHLDFDLRDWLVITIPEAAYQAIRAHPAVKYLQRVVRGPFAPPAAGAATESSAKMARAPQGVPPWSSGTYSYDGAGNIKAIGGDAFVYDGLSRLVSSNIKSNAETYEYDPFGNLTKKTTTPAGGKPLPVDLSADAGTNHLSLKGYDAAGNLTGDSAESNAFDPVGMQREKDIPGVRLSELYVYNASDERVGVFECIGPPASCTNAPMMWSLRDESGKVLRQYEGTYVPGTPGGAPPWAWKEDYVYREGLLLGAERVPEEGGRRHFHLDHLGTARLVTNSAGGEMAERDYYPFGVQIAPSFQDTANGYDREEPMRFTGHERDFNVATTSENANYNDFMHARPTVPQWGRFLSVDPTIPKEAMHLPQMWNRYAYVMNNPLKFRDPTGRIFELGACTSGRNDTCTAQYNFFLSSFGKQAQDAANYLQLGNNGIVSFNGITAQAFANQFGMMGHAMAYLISSKSATFTLEFAKLSGLGEKGISFFEPNSERGMGPVGGRIVIDPSRYPANLGMVSVSTAEGFAHEIGHAVGTLIPGIRDDLNRRLSTGIRQNEGYSMAFENMWRVNVLGAAPNDLRMFYYMPGDVLAPAPGTSLFP